MSLSFCVLGSGSRGNATLVTRAHGGRVRHALIDCGLSRRETNRRLAHHGLSIDDIDDVLLTHCDRDHYDPAWGRSAVQLKIRIHLHHRQRARALREGLDGRALHMFEESFELDEHTRIDAVSFAHDDLGTTGFVIDHAGARLGFATDLGAVPSSLYERFTDLHALALESNYDPDMQVASNRPMFLKRRIMGGRGHLSNMQALRAIRRIAGQSKLTHIALLHLSQECNDAELITALYRAEAPDLAHRLTITSQHEPSPVLTVTAPEPELMLF
ncbi:MAG: MBL fold metallo-hydrolase [Phycisphaerales bacterium]|nr:MBL fold metallo-hydrolase [Phycisphaerales bacterium]